MQLLLKKHKALTQKCRFRIMYALIKAKTPLCICELMDVLQKPQYKISRCLIILKKAGLIREERSGRLLLHSPDYKDICNKALFNSIRSVSQKENPELAGDMRNLKKRLALREKGKIVVTYKK